MKQLFITNSDALAQTDNELLAQTLTFGLPEPTPEFRSRVHAASPQAAALGYVHITQLAFATNTCPKHAPQCVANAFEHGTPQEVIGFTGFRERVANFTILVVHTP